MQKLISAMTLCLVGLFAAPLSARASFHSYDIKEVFSSSDGSVQFVELFTFISGQQFLDGIQIIASQGASSNTFVFPSDGPAPTASRHLLIANAAFEAACGITPDFILPDNFLFDPDGTVNFANVDIVNYTTLPLDGKTSLNYPGGATATNSPTNFAGDTCSLTVCGDGVLDDGEDCDDGNQVSGDCCDDVCAFESPGSACDDASVCTTVDTCDGAGLCVGAVPLPCDDANGCTDDGCDPGTGCFFDDNSAPCDDLVFCNGADTCGGGACGIHAGDPCPGPDGDGLCAESCNEGADDCTAADPNGSSCTDDDVCTLVDLCAAGSCAPGDPLDCDDGLECTADSCDEITGCANEPIEFCFEEVPAGGSVLWLVTALTLLGLGVRILGPHFRTR